MRLLPLLLLLLSTAASAFELKKDREGDVVRWTGAVNFTVDPDLDHKLHAPGAADAVRAALATWSAALPGVELTVAPGECDAPGYVLRGRNLNTITVIDHDWPYDDGVMAVTIVTVDYQNNRIVDADIVFNAAQNHFKVLDAHSKRGGSFADVQNTITHELGHALGLQHVEKLDAVMYPMAYNGDVDKRDLTHDELSGLDVLYPLQADPGVGCSASGAQAPLALALVWLLGRLSRGTRGRSAAADRC
jgi:hypothetical protein